MSKPTLTGLIGRGYFPKELPPAFNTRSLALVARDVRLFPSELLNPTIPSMNVSHNYLARANSRRRLGIVNPVNFIELSSKILSNWGTLIAVTNQSQISLTSPIFSNPPGRAISYKHGFDSKDDRKAVVRSNSRYILQADISQFYHSVYTHSIAWALHGKQKAKAEQYNRTLLGNQLDKAIRNSQDRQTIGIPIGPDTSLLIAEIILTICDVKLKKKKITNVFRYIDDYEFGCQSLQVAESCKDYLQEILGEFELVLNPDKTRIIELPIPLESPCISFIRTSNINEITNTKGQRYALIKLFDNVFENLKQNDDISLIKYLLGRLTRVSIVKENWRLYENLMLQCVIADPSTLSYVLDQLLHYSFIGYSLDLAHISDIMNSLIITHAPINHSSEVAWALWTLIVLDQSVSDKAARTAAKMNDSVVAILLLDARAKRLISPTLQFGNYESLMTEKDLREEQWLLSYEANVKKWLPSKGTPDHVKLDPCFRYLKSHSVEFYDAKWLTRFKSRWKKKREIISGGGGDLGVY